MNQNQHENIYSIESNVARASKMLAATMWREKKYKEWNSYEIFHENHRQEIAVAVVC